MKKRHRGRSSESVAKKSVLKLSSATPKVFASPDPFGVVDLSLSKRASSGARNSAPEILCAEFARSRKTARVPVLPEAASKPSPFSSFLEGRAPSRPQNQGRHRGRPP